MRFMLEAACICHKGKIRSNNEDNFYFDGKCLPEQNEGLRIPAEYEEPIRNGIWFSVFDGMGGENFGETASFTAARALQQTERTISDYLIPTRNQILNTAARLNEAVVKAAQERHTERMGSTMAGLYFTPRYVYVCNMGDSRAYRLRNGEFMQLSRDHVDARPIPQGSKRKAPLTQYLGIDPEYMVIEPHIAKGELEEEDQYLICSDGITDMLTNFELTDILMKNPSPAICAEMLEQAALDKGGRDNLTAIVCRIWK